MNLSQTLEIGRRAEKPGIYRTDTPGLHILVVEKSTRSNPDQVFATIRLQQNQFTIENSGLEVLTLETSQGTTQFLKFKERAYLNPGDLIKFGGFVRRFQPY
jgi:hypothetical protein